MYSEMLYRNQKEDYGMNLADRKVELERELASVKREMKSCNHEWGETKYDPKTVKEPYGYKLVGQGSDTWFEPEGYRDVEKKRWSQTCKKCGDKRYTEQTRPTGFEPTF